jgi:hypothetical protein
MREKDDQKDEEKVSMKEFRKSALLLQAALSEQLLSIANNLKEWDKDPKMRGGKRYVQNARAFAQLSKRFSENMALVEQVETQEGGAESDDLISRWQELQRQDDDLKERNPGLWQELQKVQQEELRVRNAINVWRQNREAIPKDVQKRMLMTIKAAKRVKRTLMLSKKGRSSKILSGLDI